MSLEIKLIVGLGNPGSEYSANRHNVGFKLLDKLLATMNVQMRSEKKFYGEFTQLSFHGHQVRLLKPMTFMNRSGQAIQAVANFYKLAPENILVVHDELDLPVGRMRIKRSGGHGGHNGLRDTIDQLHSKDFYRLRVGIGHPGDKKLVSNFVLGNAPKSEQEIIDLGLDRAIDIMPYLLDGDLDKSMNQLHTS